MSTSNNLGMIDKKYIIKSKLGEGAYSIVYKVQNIETNEEYAVKMIKLYCKNEIKINTKFSNIKSPYITKFIEFSQGSFKLSEHEDFNPYLLLELSDKGELNDYINCGKNGFNERHCKLIFYEILKGVLAMHNINICHRDIKAQNILLTSDKYNIKICDFGFSSDNSEMQNGIFGTREYMAPEVIMGKEYDGIKADIFSLGVLLFYLRTSRFLFDQAKTSNNNLLKTTYDYIKNKNNNIWKISEVNNINELSDDFKDLYLSMVAFDPNERPSISQILNHNWFKEIINLAEIQYMSIRSEITEELKKRKEIILSQKKN